MREILFRGKTQQHTRWIYGDLNHYMCDDGVFIAENGHSMHRVFKETIGQYTGLTDKNGTKIFEGDIVDIHISDLKKRGCVFYGDRAARYGVVLQDSTENYSFLQKPLIGMYEIRVIGNIHDNPELLKERVGE